MAGKRKLATKLETFYIQSNPEGKTPQELADELGLFKTTVEKLQAEAPEPEPQVVEAPKQSKPNNMEGKIINQTEKEKKEGKKPRFAIMTPTASEWLDDANKIARQKARGNENKSGIAKPYPDRD